MIHEVRKGDTIRVTHSTWKDYNINDYGKVIAIDKQRNQIEFENDSGEHIIWINKGDSCVIVRKKRTVLDILNN